MEESIEPEPELLRLDELDDLPEMETEPSFDTVTDLSTSRSTLADTFLVDTPQLSSWLQSKPSLCSASLESSMNLASM